MSEDYIWNIVNRNMKDIAINHAKEKGATVEQLNELRELESSTDVWAVVTVLFGYPYDDTKTSI